MAGDRAYEAMRQAARLRRHQRRLDETFPATLDGFARPAALLKASAAAGAGTSQPVTGVVASGAGQGAHLHAVRSTAQTVASGGAYLSWGAANADHGPVGFGTPVYPATEFTVETAGYYDVQVHFEWSSWTGGGTVEVHKNGVRVWPSTADTAWSASGGTFGTTFTPECAKGLEFAAGDSVSVWVDHGDGTSKDVASAVLAVELVDKGRAEAGVLLVEPPSGFLLRYKASSLSLSDGTDVTLWENEGSASNYDLTVPSGDTAPAYRTNGGPAGGAALEFESTDRLVSESATDNLRPATHIYVAQFLSDGSSYMDSVNDTTDMRWVVSSGSEIRYGSSTDPIATRDSNWHYLSGREENAAHTYPGASDGTDCYYDGTFIRNENFGSGIDSIRIGGLSSWFLVEFLAYPERLSDDDFSAVNSYITQTYGL